HPGMTNEQFEEWHNEARFHLFFRRMPHNSEQCDDYTERLGADWLRSWEQTHGKSISLPYVQVKSTLARFWACRGDVEKSKTILSEVNVGTKWATEPDMLYGLYQAYWALAKAYLKLNQLDKAKDELDQLHALVASQQRLPGKEKELKSISARAQAMLAAF